MATPPMDNLRMAQKASSMKSDIIDKRTAIVLGCIVVGVIGLVWFTIYLRNNATCTMGVNGTAANVTFKGNQAADFCSDPTGWKFGGTTFYTLDQPQGVILCEGTLTSNGTTAQYTIRDTGVLDVMGSELCQWFGKEAPSSP